MKIKVLYNFFKTTFSVMFLFRLFYRFVLTGLKRPLDSDEDNHIHNMKRSREDGPQLEVRCLIQSKVESDP